MSAVLRATQSFVDPAAADQRSYPSLPTEMPVGMKDFLRSHSLPCFAKIGRHSPNRRGSNRDEEVFLHCVAKVSYVVADEMSVVHRKHIQPTSQRFYVPLDCRGWFEVLSQDGMSARAFGSVAELAKLGVSSRCLVRQSIGGYVRKTDGYDTHIVRKGDVLAVSDTLWISTRSSAGGGGGGGGGGGATAGTFNKQLLRCTDQRGQEVFLDLNQRGLFSPIAGSASVTGAHSVKSLLTKFRLPVMVRLLYGNIGQATGSAYSTGVFKLMNVFADEILFALPTKSRPEDRILPVPTRTRSLRLRRTQNSRDETISTLSKHCRAMVNQHLDTILSIAAIYESSWLLADIELEPVKVAAAAEEKRDRSSGCGLSSRSGGSCPADPEEEELFREIEDIYNNIANPVVPRPIVFATGSAARSKGLRRNMTSAPKADTAVEHRPLQSSAQKTRVLDDNWQMLPRELVGSMMVVQTNVDANDWMTMMHAAPHPVHTTPKHDRMKQQQRRVVHINDAATTHVVSADADSKHRGGDHLYEEIPYFSKTSLDESAAMDVQKTMYISDNSLSNPESSFHDSFERGGRGGEGGGGGGGEATVPDSDKPKMSDDFLSTTILRSSDTPRERKPDARQEQRPPRKKRTRRPKSFAGTPFTDVVLEVNAPEIPIDGGGGDRVQPPLPPPPLPPKRGESMCNLRDELLYSPTAASAVEFSYIPEISVAMDPPATDDSSAVLPSATSPVPTSKSAPVDRRQSSSKVVSSAVKTLGNVSRSFLNTFRKIGGRSSSTLVINSSGGVDEDKQPEAAAAAGTAAAVRGGSSSRESVNRSSTGSSPEPVLGDRPDVVPESSFSGGRPEEEEEDGCDEPAAVSLHL